MAKNTYASDVQTKSTPQTEPVRGKNQIKNRAGGYGFQLDDWGRLDRFLILGHEGGTYYATRRELSFETVYCIDRCLQEDAARTVQTIVDVSLSGRAPKNDPAIFALAYVASKTGTEAATLAMSHIKDVCRIGTHLFDFLNNCKTLGRGWGKGFMRHVGAWYQRNPDKLAMQVTKYAQRNGWSHRDVLRKCHFTSDDAALNNVLRYVTQHEQWLESEDAGYADEFLAAVDEAKDESTSEKRVLELITDYGLVREHLATQHLNRVSVWEALLQKMPLTAMLRNLGKMTSIGLTVPLSNASTRVCAALADREALKGQRVHPIALLIALKQYQTGHGLRGSLSWTPDQSIVAALDDTFYAAFDLVEPTGQKFLLGVDVSGSMGWCNCQGNGILTCAESAAAMAMLAQRTEPQTWVFGFADSFRDLKITKRDSLADALRKTSMYNFGGTDCALPMRYARKHNLDVDMFCVYTDNETWAGNGRFGRSSGHVCQELDAYRQKTGKPAKLAVFGLAQTDFTIADPDDPGQMDFVGFDATAPTLLADFASS